jgi:hypothetical protein
VIVNTNNLVHVPGNIDQQAKLIQEFLKEKGRDEIAITIASANEAKKRPTEMKVFYPNDERVDIEKGTDLVQSKPQLVQRWQHLVEEQS